MTMRGVEFLEGWIEANITQSVKDRVDGDAASLAID